MVEAVRDLLEAQRWDGAIPVRIQPFGAGVLRSQFVLDDGESTAVVTRPRVSLSLRRQRQALQFGAALLAANGATYTATFNATAVMLSPPGPIRPLNSNTAYAVQSSPEAEASCTITGSVEDAAGDTLVETGHCRSNSPSVTMTTGLYVDIDGVVDVGIDGDIADDDMLVVSLTCTGYRSGAVVESVELMRVLIPSRPVAASRLLVQ